MQKREKSLLMTFGNQWIAGKQFCLSHRLRGSQGLQRSPATRLLRNKEDLVSRSQLKKPMHCKHVSGTRCLCH